MLPSQQAVTQALTVSAACLAQGGLLYLDVATPWTAAPDTAGHLAPFLRFAGSTRLEGRSIIDVGGMRIRRGYTSTLLPDRVAVRFRYQAASGQAGDWADFETEASWLRIEPRLLLGGEPVTGPVWNDIAGHLTLSAANLYGPTECTVDATAAWITGPSRPHIGQPLPGIDAYVLDDALRPVLDSATGELYLVGLQLAL